MLTLLTGHTSFETAYVVNDYPYGFRLRCKIAYWIETKGKHGMRFMSRTTNPKKAGEVWNKPKASTYSALMVMGLDDIGHVKHTGTSFYDHDALVAFVEKYAAGLDPTYAAKVVKYSAALHKLGKALYGPKDATTDPAADAAVINTGLPSLDATS